MGAEFDAIKNAVTAEGAARYYGLEVNARTHRARCPFHGGEHENLSFHGSGFRCFVCGASGTAIDFTMQYLGLPAPMDAARRLDRDFNLELFDKRPSLPPSWGTSQVREADRYEQAFIRWAEKSYPEFLNVAHNKAYILRTRSCDTYMTTKIRRRIHREMLSSGRKYALLQRYMVFEAEQGTAFNVFMAWGAVSPLSEAELQRVYHLFAADRERARVNIEELERSPSPLCRDDARRLKEAYCLD